MDRYDARPSPSPWAGRAARTFLTLVLVGIPLPARAQNPTPPPDPWAVSPDDIERARHQPLFESTEPLELTLTGPFTSIRKEDRGDDAEPRPGTLSYKAADGTEVKLDLKLSTRGNWRRDKHNCDFPPIWLDLDKDQPAIEGTIFDGQNRLKLYVTCNPKRDEYQQYILAEYLVYPTYNMLTDESFRARLAHVSYDDTEKPDDSFTSWAFILEHKDKMAARNSAKPVEANAVHPRIMQPDKAALEAIFNYMIGMTDYSTVYRHNVEIIRETNGDIVPVSYDFDWSGLVNTRYAVPDPKLPIRTVRDRIYQGFCWNADFDAIFQRFMDHRDQILALWRDFPLLEERRREKAVDYLEDFFKDIAKPDGGEKIVRDCMKIPSQ